MTDHEPVKVQLPELVHAKTISDTWHKQLWSCWKVYCPQIPRIPTLMLAVHTPKVSQQMLKYISQNAALCLYEQYQTHLSAYSTNSNDNNINKKYYIYFKLL